MSEKVDAVSVRTRRLFQSIIAKTSLMKNQTGVFKIGYDALIDSFLAVYDECSKDELMKNIAVSYFVNKHKNLVNEIKALRVNICDFELKGVIGRGCFGEVRLATEKFTGDVYAIKIINKSNTLKNSPAALFEEERDILSSSTSPWLVKLQYAFQDKINLYIVMDYEPGGDLSSLLDREGGRLSTEQARFYLAETLQAVRTLHCMRYVHRNITPENLLVDSCGHVKLADFASAARLSTDGKVTTAMPICDSVYIAPEISEQKGRRYGVECDFWSIGILAYFLVCGTNPERSMLQKRLANGGSLSFPLTAALADSLKDLIQRFLVDAQSRLDFHGASSHAFFLEIDFNSLRKSVPPIVPVVSAPDDTSNFIRSDRTPAKQKKCSNDDSPDFSGKQLPFIGFTNSGFDSAEVSESANSCDKKAYEALRKENQDLLSKLFAAQEVGKSSDSDTTTARKLEKAEKEKAALQKAFSLERQTNAELRKTIDQERLDRRRTEEEALKVVKMGKQNMERDMKTTVATLQAEVENLTDRLTLAYTINNELTSQCDRSEGEITAMRVELETYKRNQLIYEEKLTKAMEFKRRRVSGFESKLDKIQNEHQNRESLWQEKMANEAETRESLAKQMNMLKNKAAAEEGKNRAQLAELREEIAQLKNKLVEAEAEITRRTKNEENSDVLQDRLNKEELENNKLRAKLNDLETEISNANVSFLEHEAKGQQEHVEQLERDLKKLSQEKIQLQSIIQNSKERDKEQMNKLAELEKMLSSLECETKKLEKENAELKSLKRDDACTLQLTSAAETQYQQKIIVLNERISKLEEQVDKLKEAAILDKQDLRNAHSKLWKTEKELSDAKIDVRIAKRESKTAEEQSTKLQEEVKSLKESAKNAVVKYQEAMDAEVKRCQQLTDEVKKLKAELETLRNVRNEAEKSSTAHKQLQGDYNNLRQQIVDADRKLMLVGAEKESAEMAMQTLMNEKLALDDKVEELQSRVNTVELNNTVLKEAASMLDEQLSDYETFVADQSSKLHALQQEKATLSENLTQLQSELSSARNAVADEKSQRAQAENQVTSLETELSDKTLLISELQGQLESMRCTIDTLAQRLSEKELQTSQLETELEDRDFLVEDLRVEISWLKQETTNHLTNMYSLKESNYKLNHQLEEESRYNEALQDRIRELEGVITELEAFHRQRELKDDATKQQQNKLIAFLQTKLQEDKKKKTLADKLFGNRRKDTSPSPQTPSTMSPRNLPTSPKSTSGAVRKKPVKQLNIEKVDSPTTRQACNDLMNSPASRMQRQMSLPRMHHKIPHRFKNQLIRQAGKCASCHDTITRGSRASLCSHCSAVAHPNCAPTAPKTCCLPAALAKHFAKTVERPNGDIASNTPVIDENMTSIEGWLDIMNSGELAWKKRYLRVANNEVLVYEKEPTEDKASPCESWNLKEKTLIADGVPEGELKFVAKNDLPFIIKVVSISSCWPSQTRYLLIRKASDKPKWLTVLQNATCMPEQSAEVKDENLNSGSEGDVSPKCGNVSTIFENNDGWEISCLCEVNEEILLLGSSNGLFSLRLSSKTSPVQIFGISSVFAIELAPTINIALFICGDGRRLVTADYRSTVSNAGVAACASPSIKTEIVELSNEDPITLISTSPEINGTVYLVAATSSRITILQWSPNIGCFTVQRFFESTSCSCVFFHGEEALVGDSRIQAVNLYDYSVRGLLDDREVKSAFIKINSYPILITAISAKELLLCFNEFGLFVDVKGRKTRPDLKWAQTTIDFAYCEPYLYVIGTKSVEVLRLSVDSLVPDDSSSLATTATLNDTTTLTMEGPQLLGKSQKGVFIETGKTILFVDGTALSSEDGRTGLKRYGWGRYFSGRKIVLRSGIAWNGEDSEGRFSFTSSLNDSLDVEENAENVRDMKHTAL